MKIFLSFFCLVTAFFAGLQAAEPALTISNSWRGVAGPGKVTAADGIIVTERAANASRAFIAIADAAADDGFYLFTGKVSSTTPNAVGAASIVARNAKGAWLREWGTGDLEVSSEARSFAVRLYAPEGTTKFEVNLKTESGKLEFSELQIVKTSWSEGRAADAPELEFWINMDYFDNVVYAKNLGLENYDEAAIVNYFKTCRELGVTGVQWRVSANGLMAYPTKVGTPLPGRMKPEQLTPELKRMAKTLTEIDPLAIAVREAKKNGIQIYIWMTLSDEAYNHPTIENYCVSEFQIAHPNTILLNREGKPLPGTMCYNEPEAFQYRIDIVKELLSYGADGLYLCSRSHSFSFGLDKGDEYGFNPSVVAEYKKRYGVDILTEDFDLEKWRAIKAEAFDRLIKEIGDLAHAAGQKVRLGTSFNGLSSGRFGSNWGNMPVDWRRYLREGWIDSMVSGQNNVVPFFAGVEINLFRQVAKPEQKFYFWAQMVDYKGSRVYPLADLIKQAEFFAFFGANGGIYHESVNLEERDSPQKYFIPLTEFYKSVNTK